VETEIVVAIVAVATPGLAFVYQQLYWHASYQAHKLQKMDQSATETQATETGVPTVTSK
jgi:hypothetical protein